jgi:Cu(I)/Ag(I) efflux system membrane fusion protein
MMKHTNTVLAGALMLALGLVAGWGASALWRDGSPAPSVAPSATERKVLYWYDPMVPTQRFDKPGKSPFMEMQLVPRYADEAGAEGPQGVSVSPQAQQSLGLRVATAEKRTLAPVFEVVGNVGLNDRDVAIVQARSNGFVERVHARAPGDVVASGAALADVLHPDWLAAQTEYLAVRRTGDAVLTAASRARLTLLGMPAALVERIENTGQPEAVSTVRAPIGGLITELMVRQGVTVSAGMTLARINGLGTVWVEAAVPEALAAAVRSGQAAELRFAALPGEVFRGRVATVLPEATRDSRTLRVRIELPNPGLRLRAGMFAQVALQAAGATAEVMVPAEAVIRTGRRALVYVLDAPGHYRPVEVELGAQSGEHIVIRRGIDAGQQVVASGQFLIDSEASLQGLTARGAAPAPTSTAEYETTGTVSAIEAGQITLDHAPVPALKWPAMTMPFQLARPDLAQGLKPGDAVKFRFRQQGAEHRVTAIERTAPAGGRP